MAFNEGGVCGWQEDKEVYHFEEEEEEKEEPET